MFSLASSHSDHPQMFILNISKQGRQGGGTCLPQNCENGIYFNNYAIGGLDIVQPWRRPQ